MKLTVIILITACLHISAAGFSQNITLSEKKASLETVLGKIEKQSGYTFWYKLELIKNAPKISLNVKNSTLDEILSLCFKDLPLTYTIVQNTIVLKAKNESNLSNLGQLPILVQITGTVKDEKNVALPGVTVTVKGTRVIVVTDADGHFKINVPDKSAVLVFTYVGYNPKEVVVGDNTNISVSLEVSARSLGEVTVTGALGIQKRNDNLGYSVSTVKGDELDRTNTVNPIAALQGKVAGVVINTMSSAGVQTSPFIQIRGAKVLGDASHQANNQPIFVIDGNVLQNNIVGPDAADGGSQLKNLNPDDYESITVLKGAAATALYGSRGLNGAVVITTKTGKAGQGLGVEYSSTYSKTQVYKPFMALQNEYGMGSYYREGAFRPDGSQNNTVSNWGPAFDGTLHPAVYDNTYKTLVPYVAQPDNWKYFFQDGNFINNNITLSGGSEKGTYRISYSNTRNDGIMPKNELKRNAVDIKITGNLNKVFSTELGINYANTATSNYFNQSRYAYGGGTNLGFNTYYMPRNTNFTAWHGYYRNPDNSEKNDPLGGWTTGAFNTIDNNNYVNTENSLLAYLLLKAQATDWLDFNARGNVNIQKNFAETKNYGDQANNAGGQYAVSTGFSTDYNLLFSAHAYKKVMHDQLNIDFRLLNEYYGNLLSESASSSTDGGLNVPNQFFLENSKNTIKNYDGSNNYTGYRTTPPSSRTIGIAGVLNLNYKEYLNLELTGRNDWLSTLTYPEIVPGKNNYSVFYPSANLSYSFYDQFKEKMPSWLSTGRLRASLAYVGNAGIAGPYSTGAGYQPGIVINQNGQAISSATQINGDVRPNYDLKPQKQRSLEFGTNLAFFNDLINIDFTYYKTNTFNQLLYIPGTPETGYNKLYINAGNIQNQGIEFLATITPIRTKDWHFDVSVNLAHNASKIVKFYPGIKEWQITPFYEGAEVWAYEGGAFGELALNTNGSSTAFQIDPKTGYPIIKNAARSTATGGNQVDFANYQYAYQNATADQPRLNMGKVEPDLTGGISTNIRYKNFSLFAQIDGRLGGYVYSEAWTYAMGAGTPAASLQYRDQAHGGVARKDSYTGKTVYNGAVPNAVFAAGEKSAITGANIGGMTFRDAYNKGLVESWYAPAYYDGGFGYNGTYDWENGLNYNGAVSKNSWIALREITLGYQLPASLIQKIHVFRSARISFSARNICYLYKTLTGDQNPESLQSNDPFNPYITGGVPYTRNYAVSLNVRF
ncbi:SusC/RagA family TonB-linked outer membrane protein [Mucilaginibacter sp. SP1R1]|uniref:SusC/RagA family TonB-linked outer membrane protein n=1 Tax=Mucilaginibacter sp. SP1R1 TaxID=2723091 RepID=UPI001607B00C|nr:SusC/RagA family TonB-linked outer membrane protein [Mucilaginibacter sp. SP1R1]MBB6149346.1 iron complex outermembrane receptor protein [Mucilaginibacter sp. SP1R1]